jgi:hypothetical protein
VARDIPEKKRQEARETRKTACWPKKAAGGCGPTARAIPVFIFFSGFERGREEEVEGQRNDERRCRRSTKQSHGLSSRAFSLSLFLFLFLFLSVITHMEGA